MGDDEVAYAAEATMPARRIDLRSRGARIRRPARHRIACVRGRHPTARGRAAPRAIRFMRETPTRAVGLVLTVAYASLIGWLYVRQPQTLAQVAGGLAATIGAYQIDSQAYADGLRFFRNDRFEEARMAFGRADPAVRDAHTQFYIAYSFYRQGWGRVYSDDALFRQGLEAVNVAMTLAPGGRLVVEDPDLRMQTGEELKTELEAGLRRDASDFNPARLFRERK
jgi:hypothetical protein